MAAPITVTADNFQREVLEAEVPVLVDFWAQWCPPCKMVAPIVEDLASEYDGRMKVAKVDTDTSPSVAAEYQVMSIPTLMVFRGGRPLGSVIGYQPKAVLKAKLDALLLQPAA